MTKLTVAQVMGGGRSKYHNRKVEADGIVFDSRAEYRRWIELREMLLAGVLDNLEVHPNWTLQEAFAQNGKRYRAIKYEADFRYQERGSTTIIVEDIKGVRTAAFNLKEKLFRYRYPHLELRIVEA